MRGTTVTISIPGVQVSGLKKGDVAIFDSRILHAGGANVSSQRRVLLYFTTSASPTWPLPNGLHGPTTPRGPPTGLTPPAPTTDGSQADDRWQSPKWRLNDVITPPSGASET